MLRFSSFRPGRGLSGAWLRGELGTEERSEWSVIAVSRLRDDYRSVHRAGVSPVHCRRAAGVPRPAVDRDQFRRDAARDADPGRLDGGNGSRCERDEAPEHHGPLSMRRRGARGQLRVCSGEASSPILHCIRLVEALHRRLRAPARQLQSSKITSADARSFGERSGYEFVMADSPRIPKLNKQAGGDLMRHGGRDWTGWSCSAPRGSIGRLAVRKGFCCRFQGLSTKLSMAISGLRWLGLMNASTSGPVIVLRRRSSSCASSAGRHSPSRSPVRCGGPRLGLCSPLASASRSPTLTRSVSIEVHAFVGPRRLATVARSLADRDRTKLQRARRRSPGRAAEADRRSCRSRDGRPFVPGPLNGRRVAAAASPGLAQPRQSRWAGVAEAKPQRCSPAMREPPSA